MLFEISSLPTNLSKAEYKGYTITACNSKQHPMFVIDTPDKNMIYYYSNDTQVLPSIGNYPMVLEIIEFLHKLKWVSISQ